MDATVSPRRPRKNGPIGAAKDWISPKPPPGVSDDGRPEVRIGLVAIALFFVGFLGWASVAPLDAAVVAPGIVVVSGNRQSVQHPEGGTIERLAVIEGQHVNRGDILVELRAPELVAQERALVAQVVDLQMQRVRLDADASGSHELVRPAEWASLDEEDRAVAEDAFARHQRETSESGASLSEYGARISGYRAEIAAINRQERLVNDELSGMRQLANEQLVPLTRVRSLEQSLAELQGRRAELSAEIATTQENRSDAMRTVDAHLAELIPQLAGARERVEQSRLRSPATGRVVALAFHNVGGVVRPGEKIMDIVPEDQELVVEGKVRPEDADNLHPGQDAEVRITAFHGRGLPRVRGHIRMVSADRFTDDRTGQAYFIVQVAVPPQELALISDPGRGGGVLRPGLPAEIMARTRKRTALQYLFEPLNQALWRSFREG